MEKFKVLDLFSGIGGFSLGLERAGGFETVAFCEIEDFPRRVLAKHWPKVPCYHDVTKLTGDILKRDGLSVDIICGGFPCQNISNAGAAHGVNNGLDGDRSGLWFEYARIIGEVRPRYAIIENVKNLTGNGLDEVLRSLAKIGYDAEWDVIPGPFVGAPQPRERVWIVAYPSGQRVEGLFQGIYPGAVGPWGAGGAPNLLDIANSAFCGNDRFPQPLLRGMDDRPANWVDRVEACGNAVIPQIPELIGRFIMKREGMMNERA